MTLRETINNIWGAVHQTSRSPRRNTDPYETIIGYINRAIQVWANQPHVRWRVLRKVTDVGEIEADKKEYLADGTGNSPKISPKIETRRQGNIPGEGVYVAYTDTNNKSQITRLFITSSPDLVNRTGKAVTLAGGKIILASPFKEGDPEIGGRLMVVHYPAPDPITIAQSESYIIPVPDPNFVVYHAAYSLAESDLVQSRLSQALLLNADDRMDAMINNNKLLSQTRSSQPYYTGDRYYYN